MSLRINLSLKYIAFLTAILLIMFGGMSAVISRKHEQLIMAQIEMQAKALFQQVVITRRWIADHGGVYVEKLPWVRENPYLANATIKDMRGRRFVKENPAMVTKQLSQYSQKEGNYVFHITSLKLMNPENAPDEFEARALANFQSGKRKEASEISIIGNSRFYRYMAPLYVEQACLHCHAKQGYAVGDVRGGISVTMPMDHVFDEMSAYRRSMIAGGIIVAAALMLSLFLITRRMVITPINTIKTFMAQFSKDGVPGVPPLKTGDELEDLSKSFVDMANSLHEYHASLQEKIQAATRELTDTNNSLRQRNLRKSDFIAKLSHELRTPLTAIKGSMDYLSVKLPMHMPGEAQDLVIFFEVIKKNADRLIRLVNNVLDYERIELGKFEMSFQDVNLKESFQDVITTFKPLAEEKDVSIRLKAMDVTAFVDQDRIKQVLTNLISNALNFTAASSGIVVSLACRDETVHAAVEDSGSGVPEADREMLFRQFYTKDVKDGTGLGLAICKSIIEAHDGAIGLESAEQGGSRFWFTIPKDRKDGKPVEEKTAGNR
jgi:signal transduction histidine kinase